MLVRSFVSKGIRGSTSAGVELGGRVYSHVVCCTWLVSEYISMLFVVLGGGVYSHVVCCTWLVAEYIAMLFVVLGWWRSI